MKVGVVGCGKIATSVHMPLVKQIQRYELVAASDLNKTRLDEARAKFGIDETYDDHRLMLAKADVDAVFVCTPPEYHFQVVMDALESGKHVLCEKPLASTLEESLAIKKTYDVQRKTNGQLFLMPAHNFIFTPCFEEALKRIENGDIGKISRIKACITTNLQFYGAKTDFRNRAKCGVLEDLFPHLIYLVQRVGGPIKKVAHIEPQLKGGVVRDARVKTLLTGDVEADLTAKWTGFIPTLQLDLFGENGEITMNLLRTPHKITVTRDGESQATIMGPRLRQYFDVLRLRHPSYANEHMHFLNCALGDTQPKVTADDGLELVRALGKVTENFQGDTCIASRQNNSVVILRENGGTIEETMKKTVEMLGGLNIRRDDLVVVKPNVCYPKNLNNMIITDPKLLEAVLRLAKKKSRNVLVVESDAASGTAEKRLANTGVMDTIKKCEAEFLNLSKDDVEEHKAAGLDIALPKTALKADFLINLPKFKTSTFVGISIAMKNMFGLIAPRKKTHLHSHLAEVLVYVNQVIRQDLIITDGIVAMEGLGPISGNRVDLGLVISGRNPVTVDAACCHLAGFNPYAVEPLWKARQQGMGELDLRNMNIIGERVEDAKRKLRHPVMSPNNILEGIKTELRLRLRK